MRHLRRSPSFLSGSCLCGVYAGCSEVWLLDFACVRLGTSSIRMTEHLRVCRSEWYTQVSAEKRGANLGHPAPGQEQIPRFATDDKFEECHSIVRFSISFHHYTVGETGKILTDLYFLDGLHPLCR
jgi:hypothetical protein